MGERPAPRPATTPGSSRRLQRSAQRIALVLLGTAAGFLVGELGLRLRLRLAGTPYSMRATADELRRLADPTGVFVPDGELGVTGGPGAVGRFLHPFYASERQPDSGRVLASFRAGFPDDAYVVVVVGGSVAAGWAGTVGEDFARRLERSDALAGREVIVLNYAHAAYKEPQQLTRLAFLFALGYRPDAVVNIDGFNEVTGGITNALAGSHPVFPNGPVWRGVLAALNPFDGDQLDRLMELWTLRRRTQRSVDLVLRARLHASCLLGSVALGRVRSLSSDCVALQSELERLRSSSQPAGGVRRMYNGPPFDHDLDAVVDASVTNWSRSSRMIHALCADQGVRYLHVLQPALYYGGKPRSASEREIPPGPGGWKLGPELAYDKLRAAGRELAAHGVPFLDATGVFLETDEEIFVDACHVNPYGNGLLEQRIGEAFLARLRSEPR